MCMCLEGFQNFIAAGGGLYNNILILTVGENCVDFYQLYGIIVYKN